MATSINMIGKTIDIMSGRRPDMMDKYNPDRSFTLWEKIKDFFTGGGYKRSLGEKQQLINELKDKIQQAITDNSALYYGDPSLDYSRPSATISIEVDNETYTISEHPDGGLLISHGEDHAHGLYLKEINNFEELSNLLKTIEQSLQSEQGNNNPAYVADDASSAHLEQNPQTVQRDENADTPSREQPKTNQERSALPPVPPRSPNIASRPPVPPRSPNTASRPAGSPPRSPNIASRPPMPFPRSPNNSPGIGSAAQIRQVNNVVDMGTDAPLSLEAQQQELINRLGTTDNKVGLFQQLTSEKKAETPKVKYIDNLPTARYKDIVTAEKTIVTAPDGTRLPANRVQLDETGQSKAIISQYPKTADLPNFYKMLYHNQTPLLVVLASENEIQSNANTKSGFQPYFRIPPEMAQNPELTVTCSAGKRVEFSDNIHGQQYNMEIRDGSNSPITVPVLHVFDLPDKTAVPAEVMEKLAVHVNLLVEEQKKTYKNENNQAAEDPNKRQVVIHCKAGAGRSGQLVTACELVKPGRHLSLEETVERLRIDRCPEMIQTSEQMNESAALAYKREIPILKGPSAAA